MREMKDSGVEWIGKIPKDWEIVPLTKQLDSIVDYRGKTPEKTEEGTFLVTAKNIKDGKICYELSKEYVREADYEEIMHRGIPQIGDILFTTEAPLGQVANVDRTDIALAQRIIKFRALSTVNNYYLKYWMLNEGFQQFLHSLSTGSTATGIKSSKLFLLPLVRPNIEQQNKIVEYLDAKCSKIDEIVEKQKVIIEKLEEYKLSIITEAVTSGINPDVEMKDSGSVLNNHESLEVIEKSVRLKLKEKLAIIEEKYGDSGNNKEDARWYYLAPMLMDGVIYAKHWIEDIVWEMNTDEEDTTSEVRSSSKDKRNKGFIAHIDKLRSYLDAPEEIHLGRKPEDLLETLVNMVLGSPAICIYRSNGRSTARATSLAKVFVNNFNLPESTAIIDLAYGRCRDDNSHWQNVLKYCKDGCFQAMIDEYIHMLKETAGFQSDGNQYQIVHDMMMDSLKIHTATYIADTYPDFKKRINGADRKSDGCRIRSSYAVGFTKDAGDNSKVVMRKENIRNAFNSPMRPFVLATTSIGQEGLDFHNYCRVIMHWNLPSNPIDVGRILRTFKIKKNVEVTDNGKIII